MEKQFFFVFFPFLSVGISFLWKSFSSFCMFFCSFVGLMSQMMSNKQTNKENNNNPIISASIAQSQRGFFSGGRGEEEGME